MPNRNVVSLVALSVSFVLLSCSPEGRSGQPSESNASRGAVFYSTLCAQCHGANGQGLGGAFPPLAESEWVVEDEERLIQIVLFGLQGPIEVRGQSYSGLMVGFDRQLDDKDAAELINYIRSSWGNDASPVSPETVAKVRAENPGMPVRVE